MPGTLDQTLDKIISTIGELPASPAVVNSVMGLTSNPDSRVVDISKVLSADQSLTAKVLKLSNSSFYGRPKGVKTLDEAILLLGFATVRSIVIATSAHTMYTQEGTDQSESRLWQHSLATAVAARLIAQKTGRTDKDEVFIAALLHDIGKLVLLQKMRDRYQEVVGEVLSSSASFFETESRLLGFTHCDVAAILLEKWQFPGSLTEAIYHHHQLPPLEPDKPAPVAYLISLGNEVAKHLGVGFEDRRVDDLAQLEAAQLLELDESALEGIVAEAADYYEIETRIFEEV